MRHVVKVAALAAGLVVSASAQAVLVEVQFGGTISSRNPNPGAFLPNVAPGAAFSGTFQYESSTLPGGGGGDDEGLTPIFAMYNSIVPGTYSVMVQENMSGGGGDDEGLNFVTFTPNRVAGSVGVGGEFAEIIGNDAPGLSPTDPVTDSFSSNVGSASFNLGGGLNSLWTFDIALSSSGIGSADPFTSTDLPTSFSIDPWEFAQFTITDWDVVSGLPRETLTGSITSLSSRIVPAPMSGLAVLAGGFLAARRRR